VRRAGNGEEWASPFSFFPLGFKLQDYEGDVIGGPFFAIPASQLTHECIYAFLQGSIPEPLQRFGPWARAEVDVLLVLRFGETV